MSFGYVRETSLPFGIAIWDKETVDNRQQRWIAVGKRLKQQMGICGYGVKELAAKSGVSDKTIPKVIAGRVIDYRTGTLAKLSVAVGWTKDSLQTMYDGGEPTPLNQSADPNLVLTELRELGTLVKMIAERLGVDVAEPQPGESQTAR